MAARHTLVFLSLISLAGCDEDSIVPPESFTLARSEARPFQAVQLTLGDSLPSTSETEYVVRVAGTDARLERVDARRLIFLVPDLAPASAVVTLSPVGTSTSSVRLTILASEPIDDPTATITANIERVALRASRLRERLQAGTIASLDATATLADLDTVVARVSAARIALQQATEAERSMVARVLAANEEVLANDPFGAEPAFVSTALAPPPQLCTERFPNLDEETYQCISNGISRQLVYLVAAVAIGGALGTGVGSAIGAALLGGWRLIEMNHWLLAEVGHGIMWFAYNLALEPSLLDAGTVTAGTTVVRPLSGAFRQLTEADSSGGAVVGAVISGIQAFQNVWRRVTSFDPSALTEPEFELAKLPAMINIQPLVGFDTVVTPSTLSAGGFDVKLAIVGDALQIAATGMGEQPATFEYELRGQLMGVTSVVTPVSIVVQPACGADNCSGCCQGGQCIAGDEDARCGTDGAACADCGSDTCQGGACKAPCGPQTCSGCCDGDQCVAGNSNSLCGLGGAACSDCGGNMCDAGTCVGNCGPDNCTGCCENGICLGGGDPASCGTGGEACLSCGGQACMAGVCMGNCGPGNCNGCCWNGVCQQGTYANACGSGGAACAQCQQQFPPDPSGPVCSATTFTCGPCGSEFVSNLPNDCPNDPPYYQSYGVWNSCCDTSAYTHYHCYDPSFEHPCTGTCPGQGRVVWFCPANLSCGADACTSTCGSGTPGTFRKIAGCQ